MNIREQLVEKITAFPTVSSTIHKLLQVVDNPETDNQDVAQVIQYDPALTANVLKIVNSSYYSFTTPISSLTEAVFKLGRNNIIQIATSSLVSATMTKPAMGYEQTASDLWKHSVAVATMSDILCRLIKLKETGAIFTAAIVHDIGKIAIGHFVSEYFDDIQREVEENNIPFEEAERKILGVDHAEVGAMIAEQWSFPPQITETIRWHHNPMGADEISLSTDIVHISDVLCIMHGFGVGKDGLQYRPDGESLKRLNLKGSALQVATADLIDELEKKGSMFAPKPETVGVGR